MLLYDDFVADREPQARSLAGGFGGEKGVEHFRLDLLRYSRSVIADADFNTLAETSRAHRKSGRSFRWA